MSDTLAVDHQLVRTLQGRVADEMTRAKQHREARGERELSDVRRTAAGVQPDHRRRCSGTWRRCWPRGGELPADAGYDLKLIMAVDAAIYEAGELQELLDDADDREHRHQRLRRGFHHLRRRPGKVRGRPIAATDDDLIRIVQNLASRTSA